MIEGNEKNGNDDKSLIKRASEGESSAFGELYDKYQPSIYRFVFIKVNHREEAEDITHKVFLSALENIKRFEYKGLPLSSWLFRIARNKIIDYYRTKKNNIQIESVPEEIAGIAEESFELDIEKKMDIEKIYKALHKLTEQQKEILILKFVNELSYKEISHILGKTQGAIRVLQHRAIKNIQKILNEEENN